MFIISITNDLAFSRLTCTYILTLNLHGSALVPNLLKNEWGEAVEKNLTVFTTYAVRRRRRLGSKELLPKDPILIARLGWKNNWGYEKFMCDQWRCYARSII